MAGFVYLVKKNGFFLIGRAKNLDKKMKKIRPDDLVATSPQEYPEAFEARLLRRYRDTRLPGTSYFQLTQNQLLDCKRQFGYKSKVPKSLGEEFYIASTASVLIAILIVIILPRLGIDWLLSLSLLFLLSSIPMWLLFFLGNFGGYYSTDIGLFSTWFNRLRALIVAFLLSLLGWIIFYNSAGKFL